MVKETELKTEKQLVDILQEDIKEKMKTDNLIGGDFAYSDYRTYSLTVEEIRELKKLAREKKKVAAAKAYKLHKGKKPMRLLS